MSSPVAPNSPAASPVPAPWAERHPVFTGITTLLVFHSLLILGPLQGVTSLKPEAEPLFIGIVQLVYVVPLSIVLFTASYRKTLRVIAIGAVVTFVANLAACGVFWYTLGHASW